MTASNVCKIIIMRKCISSFHLRVEWSRIVTTQATIVSAALKLIRLVDIIRNHQNIKCWTSWLCWFWKLSIHSNAVLRRGDCGGGGRSLVSEKTVLRRAILWFSYFDDTLTVFFTQVKLERISLKRSLRVILKFCLRFPCHILLRLLNCLLIVFSCLWLTQCLWQKFMKRLIGTVEDYYERSWYKLRLW